MGRKATPGLFKRGQYWHIDKQILGQRIREGTGAESLVEAERYLSSRIQQVREAVLYGVRPKRTFRQAATKYLSENQHKRSISDDALHIKLLDEYIGELPLESIHMGTLNTFIDARKCDGVKNRTINYGLQITRRILNLASSEWIDGNGLTWLANAPKIKLLPENDARKPYPLNWAEQDTLFEHLPTHLKQMALFAVNTGCRDREICRLQWDWEAELPNLPNVSIFIIPGDFVKNKEDRLVICNKVAKQVIDTQRGQHPTHVFCYKGKAITRMTNSAWKTARKKADLDHVRVHDLKHTFGRRLRAAGVSFEDRQDLLGHRSGRITTHYSAAEIDNLLVAANQVCDPKQSTIILKRVCKTGLEKHNPHNIPTLGYEAKVENAVSH